MANGESSGVAAAYEELNGFCAEAYALVRMLEDQDAGPVGSEIVLSGCLRRLADACDSYEFALSQAGVDVNGSAALLAAAEVSFPAVARKAKPAIEAAAVLGGRSEAKGGGEAPLQSGSPN